MLTNYTYWKVRFLKTAKNRLTQVKKGNDRSFRYNRVIKEPTSITKYWDDRTEKIQTHLLGTTTGRRRTNSKENSKTKRTSVNANAEERWTSCSTVRS